MIVLICNENCVIFVLDEKFMFHFATFILQVMEEVDVWIRNFVSCLTTEIIIRYCQFIVAPGLMQITLVMSLSNKIITNHMLLTCSSLERVCMWDSKRSMRNMKKECGLYECSSGSSTKGHISPLSPQRIINRTITTHLLPCC